MLVQQQVAAARRSLRPISVVIFELDALADAPTAERDQALTVVGDVVRRTLRESDSACRLGDVMVGVILVIGGLVLCLLLLALLFLAAVAFSLLADRFRIPYPSVLVVGAVVGAAWQGERHVRTVRSERAPGRPRRGAR